MRLLIQHRSHYGYPRPAHLGPHLIRLRPATHTRAHVEAYALHVEQPADLRWQQDPYGNHVARVSFRQGTEVRALDLLIELAVDIRPVNPFDFFIDDRCKTSPFAYPDEFRADLAPFLSAAHPPPSKQLQDFVDTLPSDGRTISLIVALNAGVNARVRYVIREEPGLYTPEETLTHSRGSCRDSANLLIAVLRAKGFAARFVSGYLVQLTDEGMIPDAPRGVGRDVVDLHAWAEVFLPGGGWIGLDATSGLLCGEGHIPLACTALPALAAPIEGTSDVGADEVSFSMTVGRLGHEARPTTPYEESVWEALLSAGDRIDATLTEAGLSLTTGGEPTFNSRRYPELPEWNGDALGASKWHAALALSEHLRSALAPGALLLHRQGKHYPGEPLPRWAIDLLAHRDGTPLWSAFEPRDVSHEDPHALATRVAEALAKDLGLADTLHPAYEDPWRLLQDESSLPIDVDPLRAELTDTDTRRRLARILDRGAGEIAGHVLPLARAGGAWVSERWSFRRGVLFLIPGDSPMGLRLPLASLRKGAPAPEPDEPEVTPPDPRVEREEDAPAQESVVVEDPSAPVKITRQRPTSKPATGVRTALCVESREGAVCVFLPPLKSAQDFTALLDAVDRARRAVGCDVRVEGYSPPPDLALFRMSVTPDPGVIEVNLPPTSSVREHATVMGAVFEGALKCGLHSEKYMIDGRQAGSGGGNHVTLGGPSPLESPFVRRPDLLASVLTFIQHHPSLSYMFTGLFVGPTSQAPRVDEARHDSLYELEIALKRLRDRSAPTPPWLGDFLLRNLLVDITGNTHRTEVCIDKLFSPHGAAGRQGLLEFRAFEMPPHPRMVTAQAALCRALVAAFANDPYEGALARWGMTLHDRFLLPYWLWRDFSDVLDALRQRGIFLPDEGYRPFVDLRCPLVGTLHAGDVTLEVRNAIEPWNVLGEEPSGGGTSRYVDSSMERIEVRAINLTPGRHAVLVNGQRLPMHPTPVAGTAVAGVRFRAWCPPHSLQPHLGIHHPVRLDVIDMWARRSLGACGYHVWHPAGQAFLAPPLTRFEADARRAQRFTHEGHLPWPVSPADAREHPDAPMTLDLRHYPVDHPMPEGDPT